MSRALLLPVARALSADVCENSWSGIQSSGFYLQTPCSETLGADFRKPVLNTAPQETPKLWCEQGSFVMQSPGSSSPSFAGKVFECSLSVCLAQWWEMWTWETFQLTLLTGTAEQTVTHENTEPARGVTLMELLLSSLFLWLFMSSWRQERGSLWESALFGDFQLILHWEWWPEIRTEQLFTPQ